MRPRWCLVSVKAARREVLTRTRMSVRVTGVSVKPVVSMAVGGRPSASQCGGEDDERGSGRGVSEVLWRREMRGPR